MMASNYFHFCNIARQVYEWFQRSIREQTEGNARVPHGTQGERGLKKLEKETGRTLKDTLMWQKIQYAIPPVSNRSKIFRKW